jgi:D-glycero-alpha-D-manno-heptose-7-phosphate kinase
VIISETPLRISFLGGGTDYPEYFNKHGGSVLGTAIDKFGYISVSRFYSRLFDYSIRIAYRQVECVNTLDEIQHAPFRECLRWCGLERDVEVHNTAELPAFTGLGSSSTFVVGLLNALHAFRGESVRGLQLAHEAIKLEREVLKEAVGVQDQTFAAVGGFCLLEFRNGTDITVHRVPLSDERKRELEAHMLVVYTGMQRRASELAQRLISTVDANTVALHRMRQLVDEGYRELTGTGSFSRFGALVDESWKLKQSLDHGIANGHIQSLYERACAAGAFGGKLLGAGGGGFLLLITPPERKNIVRDALGHPQELDVHVGAPGSHIIHS